MRSMPSIRASSNRCGWCTAFFAHIRRFSLGASIANARALPCQEVARNAPTHVAGRNGLLVRGAFGYPDCASFMETLCLDRQNGRSAQRGLAGELYVLLRLAGIGCRDPIARQRRSPDAGWQRFGAVKL